MSLSNIPMILDVKDSMPVLVSVPAGGYCPRHVSGDRSYTYYVYNLWKDGRWTQLPRPPYDMVTDRNLVRPAFRRHLSAIIHGNYRGVYEQQAVHGRVQG
jgi:hypothetical protein